MMDKEGARDCIRNVIGTLKDLIHHLGNDRYIKCHMDVTMIENNMKSIRWFLEEAEEKESNEKQT